MARHIKIRNVGFIPNEIEYLPKNISVNNDEIITITLEEIESIRLSDILNLNQIEAANSLNVSRATYQRILLSARKKVALSLIECKRLVISGGQYNLTCCKYIPKQSNTDFKNSKYINREKCNSSKIFCIKNCCKCRGGINESKK